MIRTAAASDLDDVARLLAEFRDWFGNDQPGDESIRSTAARLLEDPATTYLLAVDDDGGGAVGVCQLRFRLSIWTGADDCWLEDLFVTADARSDGHGRALVEAAFDAARARGCKRIELDVNVENQAALRLYTGLGFTTEPKPPGKTLYIARRL
jgi:ribosomal protein S18 acetylase RimI-like enzyme